MISIAATLGKMERTNISGRTKTDLSRAKRAHTQLGRRPLNIDVKDIHAMESAGKRFRTIAAETGWSL